MSAGPGTTFSSSTSATTPTMRRGCGLPKYGSVHHSVAIERLAAREHALREALAHDHHQLLAASIVFGEVAAGDERDAERGEEARA